MDWCLIHKSGLKAICSRVKSGKSRKNAGWLHYIAAGQVPSKRMLEQKHEYLTTQQVQEYLQSITEGRNGNMIERQAKALGLSLDSLIMMHVTYDQDKAAIVAPMFDHMRMPTGCRYRRNDGKKYSLKGGREGVFLSRNFTPYRTMWIAEGMTDPAAVVEIGFDNVIGRPNCSGGFEIIKRLVSKNRRAPVIIVADPDAPGIDGATSLAQSLPNPCIVIVGPCDIREYVTKRLQSDARNAILEGINGDEVTTWHPVFRNQSGLFHDFVGSLQKRVV